jgi:hypothetical protein
VRPADIPARYKAQHWHVYRVRKGVTRQDGKPVPVNDVEEVTR